jgi:hypothetical protein
MFFSFWAKGGHQGMLRAPDMMLEYTTSAKKYVGDVGGVMVKNIL